ncbi:MAG: hypothetical protein AAB496_00920 [Patescibacteria group bacterium]
MSKGISSLMLGGGIALLVVGIFTEAQFFNSRLITIGLTTIVELLGLGMILLGVFSLEDREERGE